MVATTNEVAHSAALVASLPAFVLGKLQGLLQVFVLGAVFLVLSCLALSASRLTACRAGGDIVADVSSADELCAGRVGAVGARGTCGCVELLLLVLELGGELRADFALDIFPGHGLLTAARRIQRFIGHAGAVELLQASGAVVVAARCVHHLVRREWLLA
jgi:hypothetical protein